MTQESLVIDHIIMGVADLATAGEYLRDLGLPVMTGGTHPDWGTANTIVPLGDTYLELVAVIEPDIARHTGFGSAITAMVSGERAWGWAVRSTDLASTADRWDRPIAEGSRSRPDGSVLRWQLTGADRIEAEQPFAIAWGNGVTMPGEIGGTGWWLEQLTIGADPERLREWLGGDIPRVRISADQPPGVHQIALGHSDRELVVNWPLPV